MGDADDPFILAYWVGCTDALLALEYPAACIDAADEDEDGSVTFHATALPDGSVSRRFESLILFFHL